MRLIITLKVTKKQGFTLSLEDTFLEKPGRGVKLTTPLFLWESKIYKETGQLFPDRRLCSKQIFPGKQEWVF